MRLELNAMSQQHRHLYDPQTSMTGGRWPKRSFQAEKDLFPSFYGLVLFFKRTILMEHPLEV